ncbi:MAG: hypothetical protein HY907_19415 [Deltaproteobacteria bacterium]|nr:hypothetical protein [Deltaproteobacteria bacterium]
MRRILVPALLAAALGCGPPATPQEPPPDPAARQRNLLLRPGGLFVQVRLDRVRTWLPSLGEIAALSWTPDLPGASCLVDFVWSAELAAAWLATPGTLAAPTSGAALFDGVAAADERVETWMNCVLAGLGSGAQRRDIAAPPDASAPSPPPPLSFLVGTGRWRNAGLAPLDAAGRYGVVVGEPFETWALELAGLAPPPAAPAPGPAALVEDADVQLVWLDADAVVELLERGSAGLGPVPPPEEIRGVAAGLWLGERPHADAWVQARGPEAAAAVADTLRTFATMLELSVSVQAAQLGNVYGADIQQRAEQVAAIAEQAVIDVHESLVRVHLDLTPAQIELVQGFALALASRGLQE